MTIVLLFLSFLGTTQAQEKLAPYIKIGQFTEDMSVLSTQVGAALKAGNFEILGTYNPENNPKFKSHCFYKNRFKKHSF